MAGDWIKVEKATARKPEVLRVADILGVHPDQAFGICVRFWFWCDDNMTDGRAPGVTHVTLNAAFGHAGFVEALLQVGWLRVRNGSLEVPNFDRHLSESAKNRALSGERKRKQRSRSERDTSVTREEKSERKRREDKSDRTDRSPRPPPGHSDLDVRDQEEEQFDLSRVDWGQVEYLAEKAGKVITPQNDEDRRAFLRYAVMAQMVLSQHWFLDALGAVNGEPSRKNRQARIVGALQKGAKSMMPAMDKDTFNGYARRIKIPDDVWNRPILEVSK